MYASEGRHGRLASPSTNGHIHSVSRSRIQPTASIHLAATCSVRSRTNVGEPSRTERYEYGVPVKGTMLQVGRYPVSLPATPHGVLRKTRHAEPRNNQTEVMKWPRLERTPLSPNHPLASVSQGGWMWREANRDLSRGGRMLWISSTVLNFCAFSLSTSPPPSPVEAADRDETDAG